jgi:O-methyltransferase involved in polyketide biosynthesis
MRDATHARIGPTAHYTAYVWKQLGLPHADLFATRTGAALYWGFFAAGEWTTRLSRRVPSMRQYLEYRHRLIEAVAHEFATDCLVEIGAGLTRRGITWALDRGIRSVEIDLPHMAEAKRSALARSGLEQGLLEVVEGDVLDANFGAQLHELLRGADRPLVVAEGLLSYFDKPGRSAVFRAVAEGLGGSDGAFVCDLHSADAQAEFGGAASVLRLAIQAVTRRKRALDPYATRDELIEAVRDGGFLHVDIADPARYVATEPRLARVRSPAQVVLASA